MTRAFLFLTASFSVSVLGADTPKPPGEPVVPTPHTVVKVGRLFDGTGEAFRDDQVIVIENDRIKAVGPAAEVTIPDEANVLDLSEAWVLPGLIDCHTHLGSRADRFDEINKFKDTPFHSAFAAVKNAKTTLEAGFTTVRDLGGRPFLAVRPPRHDR